MPPPSARRRERRVGEVDRLAASLRGQHGERDRAGEHQQRADQRVDHELRRRRDAAGPAPDAGQQVERDQHQVEEGDEQRQVLGEEGAEHRRLGDAEQQVEELRLRPRAQVRRQQRRARRRTSSSRPGTG